MGLEIHGRVACPCAGPENPLVGDNDREFNYQWKRFPLNNLIRCS